MPLPPTTRQALPEALSRFDREKRRTPQWALKRDPHQRAWIFQGNPAQFDLLGALDELDELTWVTRQNRAEIHPGNTVYLWESGQWAGVLAVASVLTEPADVPISP